MKLTDVFDADAVAINWTEAASNREPYLGEGLFPSDKKAGLDLKWIKGYKGLPVSLAPSTFDAPPKFRERVGIAISETEMPFFREGMLIKEKDEQEIDRVRDSSDPYAQQVLDSIFNDSQTLIDGALVVPERMRMQLLSPIGGNMGIDIASKGVKYTYNYDPDGSWKAEHYTKIVDEVNLWTNSETCDPVADMEKVLDAQDDITGNRPTLAIMSKDTFNLIKASKKVRDGVLAQNTTANVNYTSSRILSYMEEELKCTFVIYNKKYKNEAGIAQKFYPDNIIAFLPEGTLGKTWFGTTPEERSAGQSEDANVSIVNTGIAINVTTTSKAPIQTETTASEIVLPSFERMDEVAVLEVAEII